ncbi:hypothetical protein [Dysgonomonas termitidis]|uniref:Uncharacterized protein n=1 Tax=Dysgonomonas termitidis TaxID=1516126 RepID=A0ABV9KQ11_9BACT
MEANRIILLELYECKEIFDLSCDPIEQYFEKHTNMPKIEPELSLTKWLLKNNSLYLTTLSGHEITDYNKSVSLSTYFGNVDEVMANWFTGYITLQLRPHRIMYKPYFLPDKTVFQREIYLYFSDGVLSSIKLKEYNIDKDSTERIFKLEYEIAKEEMYYEIATDDIISKQNLIPILYSKHLRQMDNDMDYEEDQLPF